MELVKTITLDLETTGLDWQTDKILLNGYRINRNGPVILVDPEKVDETLNTYLSDPSITLSGANIKFDALFLSSAGYNVACQLECTKVLAYLCWPNLESHGLKFLVRNKLNREVTDLSTLLFKPLKRELIYLQEFTDGYFTIDDKLGRKDLIGKYHQEDILNVDRLRTIMVAPKWFYEVEKPLTRLLFEAELYGCPLDKTYIDKLQVEYEEIARNLLAQLGALQGEWNPGSSDQVAQKLQELGYDLSKITHKSSKTGKWSIDKQVLKKLAWSGESLAKTLLDYRRITKLLSTYILPLVAGSRRDGKVHGSFNQAGSEDVYGDGSKGTATGRLSSTDPNLQNIPARTKEGKQVRKCFVAAEGQQLFDTDLKQIEPRLIGHYSQSPKLIKAYNEGLDTHGMFACDIFKKNTVDLLTPTERFIGKTSWLATVYGCGFKKLLFICENFSDQPLVLDLTKAQLDAFKNLPKKAKWGESQDKVREEYGDKAEEVCGKWAFFKEVQDSFIKANPEIWGWRNSHIAATKKLGYVKTLGGRVIKIDGLSSSNKWEVIGAERLAVNYQIQPSGADIMKMICVRFGTDKEFKGQLLTTVHDEVLGQFPKGMPEQIGIVKKFMETTCTLKNIPIAADTKLVSNWSEK